MCLIATITEHRNLWQDKKAKRNFSSFPFPNLYDGTWLKRNGLSFFLSLFIYLFIPFFYKLMMHTLCKWRHWIESTHHPLEPDPVKEKPKEACLFFFFFFCGEAYFLFCREGGLFCFYFDFCGYFFVLSY